MRASHFMAFVAFGTLALAVGYFSVLPSPAAATKEKVIHAFSGADGAVPYSALIADPLGNLYGTTFYGGSSGVGTMYELVPKHNHYNERVLFSFPGVAGGGTGPVGGLAAGPSGSFYGTTEYGGGSAGAGIAYQLTPAYPQYTLTTLITFGSQSPYGSYSLATPAVFGGNLYLTASQGGQFGNGVVFGGFGIHPFGSKAGDGVGPMAGVIVDSSGNSFGTTQNGGGNYTNCTPGCGTVYEVTPAAKESVIYAFQGGADGAYPIAALISDGNGALYGTTSAGGASGNGTVFKLTHTRTGYTKKVLYSFHGGTDGAYPAAPVVMAGNSLFGTTKSGGQYGQGTVFSLTMKASVWTEQVLHSFQGGNDGAQPLAGLLIENGSLYGTTSGGGPFGAGTVYRIKT
jgi:uncharacterized repeat protein (TIGR03803 family)